jgi:biopolymer transport protein ExbD
VAGTSLYQDEEASPITDINVTPFVDVVLVLLVVFIVTAKLIVARGVEVDKPKMASGGEVAGLTLRVSVNADGKLFVNGDQFGDDAAAIAKIKALAATATTKPKAIIAGDQHTQYGGVMHAIDLVQQAGITAIALENERKP